MDSLRLVICVRPDCRHLFFLCRFCDRGQRYCSPACAGHARRVTLQGAGHRYQQSRPGRFRHAAHQARYRARCAQREIVTHQTTQARATSGIVAFAPLPIFPNAGSAIALIDRLVHHAEIITIDGDSYRRRVAEAKRKLPRPASES